MTPPTTPDCKPDAPGVIRCALLAEIEQALDDWIVTYAADHCDPAQVRAAWKRLMDNGGTIAYVTDLRERVHSANSVLSQNPQTKGEPE